MKKIIILILVLITFPLIISNAQTKITPYKVQVVNQSGAKSYYWTDDKIFEYNSILQVVDEMELDNLMFLGVSDGDEIYYLSIEDVKIVEEVVGTQNFNKHEKQKIYIYDDTYLYNGPSKNYEKNLNIVIPKDIILEYEYSDLMWAYISYNDYNGWIYTSNFNELNGIALVANDKAKILIMKDGEYKLYNKPNNNIYKNIYLNSNTEIEFKYYTSVLNTGYYYIEYGDYKGWILKDEHIILNIYSDFYNSIFINNNNLLTIYDSTIFNNPIDKNQVINISKNNKSNFEYVYFNKDESLNYYYIRYNGKSGWINENVVANSIKCSAIMAMEKNGLPLYDKINGQIVSKVPYTYQLIELFEYESNDELWSLVKYENNEYWVNILDYKIASTDNGTYKILQNVKVCDSLKFGKKCKTIKQGTIIEKKYLYVDDDLYFFVKYNENYGWLKYDSNLYEKIEIGNNECMIKTLNFENKKINTNNNVFKILLASSILIISIILIIYKKKLKSKSSK